MTTPDLAVIRKEVQGPAFWLMGVLEFSHSQAKLFK